MRGEKLSTAEKALIVVSAVLFSLAAGYGIWDYWSNLPPVVSIPAERLPNPNGFDYYVKAAREVVDHTEFEWAMSPPPPKSALVPFVPPVAPGPPAPQPAPSPGMPPSPGAPGVPPPMPGPPYVPDPVRPGATPADRAALLKKNEKALAIARAGMNYDCRLPGSCRPYSSLATQLSDLLSLEAKCLAERGEWAGAMSSCIDRVELSYELANGGCGAPLAVERQEWITLRHLDQSACKQAASRIQAILASATTYADCQRRKKTDAQADLLMYFGNPQWRRSLASATQVLDGRGHTREYLYYRSASKKRIMGDWTAALDEAIRLAEMPFPKMPNDVDYLSKRCPRFYHYNLVEDRTRWETSSATNRLFAIALALRAYRLEHGAYPASLSSLVPEYLSKIPTDPFSLKPGFIYKPKGDSYLLYSLGLNCKDDGGKPYWVDSKSDDIVAGVVQPQKPKVFHVLMHPPAPAPAP